MDIDLEGIMRMAHGLAAAAVPASPLPDKERIENLERTMARVLMGDVMQATLIDARHKLYMEHLERLAARVDGIYEALGITFDKDTPDDAQVEPGQD